MLYTEAAFRELTPVFSPDFNFTKIIAGTGTCAVSTLAYVTTFSQCTLALMEVLQFFYRHPLLQQYRWYWRVE